MKNLILFFFFFLSSLSIFSQSIFGGKKEFIYGKMVGRSDTLVGYFWFDNQITQNGQTVQFKEDLNSENKKTFQSRHYDYFESDGIYLETFGAIPTVSGDILIMIPRVINGRIQLFDNKFKWGYMNLFKSEHYFLKKGWDKVRVKKKDFKELMQRFVGDDKSLMEKIENNELKYDDLIEIVTIYNNSHPYN
jgi:hypothetical protein